MSGLEIIVGTYEEYIAAYKTDQLKSDPSRLYLKQIFSTHNHTASVRVVATNGKILASGGADDRICIFDLESSTFKDALLHHSGTINCLSFSSDGTYLFSGSHDGTITAINMRQFVVDKTWKNAHKSAVLSISVHPCDKMALSLGTDMNLRTWDLVSGRAIYTRGLRHDPKFNGYLSSVTWSPEGSYFALMGNRVVDIVCLDTTKSIRSVECHCKPVSICWISATEIAVGLDDGHLLLFDVTSKGEPEKMRAYESRLKSMAYVRDYLATASSAGDISLWKIDGSEIHEVCTTNIGCRPTCLALVEATWLGLDKYLTTDDENKEKLHQKLEKLPIFGKVSIEHEEILQEAETKSGKQTKKRLHDLQKCKTIEKNFLPKKIKHLKNSHGKNYTLHKNKKNTCKNATGTWLEEDIV